MSAPNKNPVVVKQKVKKLPQVRDKTLLGDPYQFKCPVLEEAEVLKLKEILCKLIKDSGQTPKQFATASRINVGIESTLRTINQSRAACVILSLSIKPHCLIGLIARNSEVKDESVPVFAQPKLENLCEEIFGVRSIALAFPKDLQTDDNDLKEWISSKQIVIQTDKRKLDAEDETASGLVSKKKRKSSKKKKIKLLEETSVSNPVESVDPEEPKKDAFSGDFISFSNESDIKTVKQTSLSTEKTVLNSFLSKLQENATKAKSSNNEMEIDNEQETKEQTTPMDTSCSQESLVKKDSAEIAKSRYTKIDYSTYKPLVLYKLEANKNRKHNSKKYKANPK